VDEVLQGGLPIGAISELVGPECSERTSLALSCLARMTQASKVCAWVDVSDTQGVLRHASITTTGNVYMQVVEESVMRAVNSHATAVLDGWAPTVEGLGLKGRNLKRRILETQGPKVIR